MPFNASGFWVTGMDASPGQVIEPGNWGRILLGIGPAHSLYKREMLFENARATNFPDLPSRLASSFLWGRLEEAKWYVKAVHNNDHVYEVEWDDSLPTHRGFHLCIPPHPNFTPEQTVHLYWEANHRVHWDQDPNISPIEIVTESPMRVKDAVTL